ncbi:MmgE/PrpD family protein [Edaphovirga cremea]|uniref:MmgE/PrpD family protein n=1 Tax=Edaphovirga cremea TaxID=2267246 RepID=UPI000DEF0E35|nr:MmgE/PrpD family protein [Edaphovirga cremea]
MEQMIQQELATFIAHCRYERIDQKLVTDMKYRVIDWLGCAITGANYPQIETGRQFFAGMGGQEEAIIIGMDGKYPAANAAMVNGMVGHVSELDDGHRKAIGHPGSVTLPVALALGDKLNVSSQEFLQALIIGYDIFIRLGRAVNPSHYTFWHTTGTCGAFAATATAASLMKLTPEQTNNALGIVATLASGLLVSFGTHAKALNIGHACQNGIYAASLAQQGFTGADNAITDEKGFIKATSLEINTDILQGLNEKELLSDTAFYKVYASCGHTNSPLDIIFDMLKAYSLDYKKIVKVEVETYRIAVALTAKLKTDNEDEAKFSIPYCLAVAIMFGNVTLQQFKPEILHNPEVRAFAERIFVTESTQATAQFPKRQATITVTMNNGQKYTDSAADARDVVDFNMLEKKFLDAAKAIDLKASEDILSYIKNIEQNSGIKPLLDYLRLI